MAFSPVRSADSDPALVFRSTPACPEMAQSWPPEALPAEPFWAPWSGPFEPEPPPTEGAVDDVVDDAVGG